ncbi:unnamed protein product [Lactuca saligna]|uniref:TIR domain-containing protein n=1 Tax=Lactuca saligna TaxID=75948 RepID=A0AA35YE33_LACSI|nr:unnamed protein product [Lactuca saligna]
MASSSSSSTQKSYMYDVFLSFKGEDTHKNFVDHLYEAFERQGIHIFKDDERLEKGKRINDELLKSIEESKFYIVVFSKNYASSSWCLDELVKIMECQKATEQIAYPVFYNVDPSEIRKQLGPVGEAFARHKNSGEAAKWREALEEAANLAGWNLRNTSDGHEAKVINKIVEKISLELRFINFEVDEKLVGMEIRVKHILSSLEMGVEDVRMIGIKGMGGGGKTTLARTVFNKICFSFEVKSFLENVREVSKASMSGLPSLQKQVLSNVLNDRSLNIGSIHEGKSIMRNTLCRKKVLLVLDYVNHLDQLDALAGGLNWFKPGSRIIITTREEQVLVAGRVKSIHDISLLSQEEAMCLFSRYAFGRDIPIQTYKELSLKVVHYANGLPLTIKVLGSSLCGQNVPVWEDALKRLTKIPLKETMEKLELSYTCLEEDYKEMFLNIACFLKGWRKERAIRALESCGFHAVNGLRVLEQKSLISISLDQKLGMHDHLEEMGRNIVRCCDPDEPITHSRLWIRGEIEEVLGSELVTEATRAIATNTFAWEGEEKHRSTILTKGFGNIKKLRFLHLLSDFQDDYEFGQTFPNTLRLLSWVRYPHWCLPKTFQENNLVALEMPFSRIKTLWEEGERKVLKNLRFLDLSYSRLMTLDFGLLPNLETLNLDGCYNLVELHLPTGCLRRLVNLKLNYCRELKFSFIKQLESLQVLGLSYLYLNEFLDILPQDVNYSFLELSLSRNNFQELPSSIGNLQNLASLDLNECKRLKSLPQSICSLRHLKHLYLHNCAIEELPEYLGGLQSLESLDLGGTRVKHLPNSICMLKHLKTLRLLYCKALTKLPQDLGLLESLEELRLPFSHIRDLPTSIYELKHLRELDVSYCFQLKKLPEKLGDLAHLKISTFPIVFNLRMPKSL